MTVGDKCLDSYQDVRSPEVRTLDAELHIKIEKPGTALQTQVYKYMRIQQRHLPPEALDEYNLTLKHFDSKAMYALKAEKA